MCETMQEGFIIFKKNFDAINQNLSIKHKKIYKKVQKTICPMTRFDKGMSLYQHSVVAVLENRIFSSPVVVTIIADLI